MPPVVLTPVLMVAGYSMVLSRPSSAVSAEAATVHRNASQVIEQVESSRALFGASRRVIEELGEMADECRVPDWDGYGALPVLVEGLERAESFIRALPPALKLPSPSIEPDGEIALEWISARNRMLSISFGESERVAYALIDGTEQSKGVVRVSAGEVPKLLQFLIEQIGG